MARADVGALPAGLDEGNELVIDFLACAPDNLRAAAAVGGGAKIDCPTQRRPAAS